ncbi:hypothetical protein L1049_009048 [Liquidambar formosana]|uniref:Uncharacterized protein n=1 Tax=Liquidambar formosana TaxID=63359 RepID=A0AAP0SAM3_LIQFO
MGATHQNYVVDIIFFPPTQEDKARIEKPKLDKLAHFSNSSFWSCTTPSRGSSLPR